MNSIDMDHSDKQQISQSFRLKIMEEMASIKLKIEEISEKLELALGHITTDEPIIKQCRQPYRNDREVCEMQKNDLDGHVDSCNICTQFMKNSIVCGKCHNVICTGCYYKIYKCPYCRLGVLDDFPILSSNRKLGKFKCCGFAFDTQGEIIKHIRIEHLKK